MELINSLIQPENLITLFASLAAFATVIMFVSPLLSTDRLAGRIKIVATERDKLRAQQKVALEVSAVRLREKKSVGVYSQLVEKLNLRKIFEAEASRDILRTAGFRSEKQLTFFLTARAVVPFIVAIAAFAYCTLRMSESMTIGMRVGAAFVGLVIGSYLPLFYVKNVAKKRQASVKSAWSDALDLMLICVESGMALEPSMQRVSKEIGVQSVPLAEEMQLTVAELAYLPERRKAFENLAKRTKLDTVKAVVTAMIQAERYGTPLGSALRVLAEENRRDRMAEAEKKAAALSPKLTVPMILFFLPVIFVVILGPSIIIVTGAK